MGINLEMLDCVAFIGVPVELPDGSELIKWGGTCFFVEEEVAGRPEKVWGYMVTAQHVAERLVGKRFVVRVNLKSGGSAIVEGGDPAIRWWCHPTDSRVDVAIIRWIPPEAEVKYKRWSVKDFVTREQVTESKYGPGDDVHMFGLLTYAPGKDKNMPVMRSGIVAMIPDDPIATKRGLMDAYLVEAVSVGGLSGSPVIVTQTKMHDAGSVRLKGIGEIGVLGLVHGHWDAFPDMPGSPDTNRQRSDSIHSGLTVVVPAYKILEVLDQPEMRELKAREAPTL
jgi:hypothetical protein